MAAAILTEKHLADNESGSDFEEDFAIATGQTNKIKQSKGEKNKIRKPADDDLESDDEEDNSGVDDFDDNESSESEGDESTMKKDEHSDMSDQSDVDDFDEAMDESMSEDSSDEDIIESSKSKGKSIKKCAMDKLGQFILSNEFSAILQYFKYF